MQFYQKTFVNYNKYLSDPKKKDYFALAATLALLILLILMLYPAAIHVSNINKEVSDGKNLLASLRTKRTNLEQAKASYEQVKDQLDILDTALPKGSNVKGYLKTPLEDLAGKYGLGIKSLQITDVPVSLPDTATTLSLLSFEYNISLTGDFATFQSFLKELENYTRTTTVTSTEIQRDVNKQLVFNLKARTNFLDSPFSSIPNSSTGGTNAQ